jgi:hypothetical protein
MTTEMLGHVARMQLIKIAKKNFKSKPEGKGKPGSLRDNCGDTENDSRELKLLRWRQKANNREGEPLLQEAAVLRRPQAQGICKLIVRKKDEMGWICSTNSAAEFFNPYLLLLAG